MKRLFDILVTLFVLLVTFLPFLLVAVVNRTLLGSPIFFRQERAGLYGQTFNIIKLRSMRNGSGSDKERLTRW
ncbi:MAG: sugar transferase, partial [Verrucomicrobiota bacterium]